MPAKKTETIVIKPLKMEKVKIRVVGDSPLIMHAWSAKAKRDILSKEIGITKMTKSIRNPFEDFATSMYWLDQMPEEPDEKSVTEALSAGVRFGFPLTAFKQAAISSAYRLGWAKDKMSLRGAFFIDPDQDGYYGGDLKIDLDRKEIEIVPNVYRYEPMVEIHSDIPLIREDCVRVGMGTDLRYRGEFRNWYADLTVSFNANGQYTLDQIINLINAGGTVCGVGEWRPERDGQYGMFHVDAK